MKRRVLYYLTLFLFIAILPTVSVYLYGRGMMQTFRMGVVMLIFGFVYAIIEFTGAKENTSALNVPIPRPVFFCAYGIISLMAVILPLVSALVWPFAFFALVLIYFTDFDRSMLLYGQLLCVSCLLRGSDVNIVIAHLLCGIVVMAMFRRVDEEYKVWGYTVIAALTVFVSLSVNQLLFYTKDFQPEDFLLPFLAMVINVMLMLILLKIYSLFSFQKFNEWYLTINDTEYIILSRAKTEDSEGYFHAIHTSYLSDKCCKAFDLNKDAVKTASYYWRLMEKATDLSDYSFPEDAMALLQELMSGKTPVSKEAMCVYMCDEVITMIMKQFAENPQVKIPYKKFFDTMFDRKFDHGFFNKCDMSIRELFEMKEIFTNEGLYYDFLR